MNILVTMPLNGAQKQKIEQVNPTASYRYCAAPDITDEMLVWPEIILGNLREASQIAHTENLRWIQLNNAGTEGYCEDGLLPEETKLTNATGAYGLAISEHMIGCLFELRKKLHIYRDNQLTCTWKSEGHVDVIEGGTVLSVGMGDIGCSFLRRMKALGCRTIGVKKTLGSRPEYVDELVTIDMLDQVLPLADVVALSMPGNAETYHTIDAKRLEMMKPNSVLINVGRGGAIDTEALTRCLYNGRIAGAALDVTDPEPLPAEHPLWKAPNTVITPHISGGFALPETLEQIVDICAENLQHFLNDEPLKNEVDKKTGYAKKYVNK